MRFSIVSISRAGLLMPLLKQAFLLGALTLQAFAAETFCNPLDLDYGSNEKGFRHSADPVIVLFKERYYLFATDDVPGYRMSDDLHSWTNILFSSELRTLMADNDRGMYCAPAVAADQSYLYFIRMDRRKGTKSVPVMRSADPASGRWEQCGELRVTGDPALFFDDDGRAWLYHGLGKPTKVFEIDRKTWREIPGSEVQLRAAITNIAEFASGYERGRRELVGETDTGAWLNRFTLLPCQEAAWMTKHNGRYYLQYSTPGTVTQWYCDVALEGSSATGLFTLADYSPVSMKVGGFMGSAGHSCVFQDKCGKWWRATTLWIGVHDLFERRLGLFPVTFDAQGRMSTDTAFGDYPRNKSDGAFTGWFVLSFGKKCTASSSLSNALPSLASDENCRTWWSAQKGDAGEWFQMDLEAPCRVHAVQVNFAEQDARVRGDDYHAWRLLASDDGVVWRTLMDRSTSRACAPHAYFELTEPMMLRYLKLVNVHMPHGGKFALRDLRVFGKGNGTSPNTVEGVKIERHADDDRNVTLRWDAVAHADGYLIRYGVSREALSHCIQMQGGQNDRLTFHALTRGVRYVWRIDAFNAHGVSVGACIDEQQGGNVPMKQDWLAQDSLSAPPGDAAAYEQRCLARRQERLSKMCSMVPAILFLENTEFGNAPRLDMSLSDGPYRGKPFKAGAAIHILRFDQKGSPVKDCLLRDEKGMIRDLDLSYDAKRVLFSWKKSERDDDYHLYEMELETGKVRQITREPGVADIQGRYLYDDRILFHSSRCVQVTDCNESIDVVNLYTCDLKGGDVRRLGFDQVSTQFPSILDDGRIVYTRWDYNDRGQIFTQALFTMNPDGTKQQALYGNNSWYPTSLIQARQIPGTELLVAITSGHHTPPCGKLALVNVAEGRDEGAGIRLLAPERSPKLIREDKADQEDVLYQYPYPLGGDEFLVGCSLFGKPRSNHFAIYWVRRDGARELLASDEQNAYRHPLPVLPRKMPKRMPTCYPKPTGDGIFYVDDIYAGEGLKGVARGTVRALRVIALDFRAAAVGVNNNSGEGGSARVVTPVSVKGSWDVKQVLGDAPVHADGSVAFRAPSRKALYFQAIDQEGRAVQSMRSWVTLMPGETYSCSGCHINKNAAPVVPTKGALAMQQAPETLMPLYGGSTGFSFLKEVQPILDAKCVSCHNGPVYEAAYVAPSADKSFSLTSKEIQDSGKRAWTESYFSLLQLKRGQKGKGPVSPFIHWLSPQGGPTMRKPASFGAMVSPLMTMLKSGHPDRQGKKRVELTTKEIETIACWIDLAVPFCGAYWEAHRWSPEEQAWYQRQEEKRKRLACAESGKGE